MVMSPDILEVPLRPPSGDPVRVVPFPHPAQPLPERLLQYVRRLGLSPLEQARVLRQVRQGGVPAELPQAFARLQQVLDDHGGGPGREWVARLRVAFPEAEVSNRSGWQAKPSQRQPMSSVPFDRHFLVNRARRWFGLLPIGGGTKS